MVVKDICVGLKKDGTVCVSENRYVYGLKPWAGLRLPRYEEVTPPDNLTESGPPGITYEGFEESPEENVESVPDGRPQYTWNSPITLYMPLADVKVGMYKNSSEYWVEFSCDTMDTEAFLTFLIHSTDDWGFDRDSLAERLSIVFRMYDSAWDEGNIAYSSMEGYGIKWIAYGDMKDDNRCVVGLKVNKLNEFEAALGMVPSY